MTGGADRHFETLPADQPGEWTTGQLEDHLPVIVDPEARTAALRMEAVAAYDAAHAARARVSGPPRTG
ncbi:MAG: hypothetical protein V9E82_05980 [Candidatus Nanopelagicales bacterium]